MFWLLFLAAAVWGFQPVLLKFLLSEWSPVTITAVRMLFFGVILIAYSYFREGKKEWPTLSCWRRLGLLGVFYAVNNIAQFTGLRFTTVTNTTLIAAAGPVMTAIAAVVFFRERLSLLAWIGVAISLAGTVTVISDGNVQLLAEIGFNIGDILCFLAQLAWTGYSLVAIGLLRELSTEAVTGWAAFICAGLTFLYGVFAGEFAITPLSVLGGGVFVYLVALGGIMATLIWNQGIKKVGASLSAVFLNIMPVVGMLSGWLLLGEDIGAAKLCGAGAIFLGVYLTTHS